MRYLEHVPIPWFLPGLLASILLGFTLRRRAGRALGSSPGLGWAVLVGVGITVSATLTPLRDALRFGIEGPAMCDFSRIGLAPLSDLLRVDDTSLNVLLFIPLGLALGLLPRSRRKVGAVAGAFALPCLIELTQLALPMLDRGCQSADVFDNWTGLVIGLAVGTAVGWLAKESGGADGAP